MGQMAVTWRSNNAEQQWKLLRLLNYRFGDDSSMVLVLRFRQASARACCARNPARALFFFIK